MFYIQDWFLFHTLNTGFFGGELNPELSVLVSLYLKITAFYFHSEQLGKYDTNQSLKSK